MSICFNISLLPNIQAIFTITWLIYIPPAIQYNFETSSTSYNGVELHIVCNVAYTELITEMLISGPMLLAACLFTFLARQLPDNNFEARTSAFNAYAALIIAAAFNLSYLTLKEPYDKMFYRYMGFVLNALVCIFCVYIVKLYTIYFVYDETSGGGGGIGGMGTSVSGVWRRSRTRTTSSTTPIASNYGGNSRKRNQRHSSSSLADVTAPSMAVIESTYL